MTNNKQELVAKSNELVEASFRLTLAEQRMLLFAITEARKNKEPITADTWITIKATEYATTFDIPKKQAYEQLKEAALTLYRREIYFHDKYEETNDERTVPGRWVQEVPYVEKAGIVQLQFTNRIIPYITKLEKHFTRYKLEKIAGMNSAHAIRLYELLINWGQNFTKHQQEVEITWLKNVLLLENEYERVSDLKKWVIDVAIDQINTHSDLTVTYEQRKTGRTVTHFIFSFQKKEEPKPEKPKKPAAVNNKKAATPATQQTAAKPTNAPAISTIPPGYARCTCGTIVNMDNYKCADCGRTSPQGRTPQEIETAKREIKKLKDILNQGEQNYKERSNKRKQATA